MVNQKRMTGGFTLVELIIVIAVIGVLAAILIPVLSNVIEKANLKSAMSDAKNTLTQYLAEKTNSGNQAPEALIFVEKADKMYVFGYSKEDACLVGSAANPYDKETYSGLSMEDKAHSLCTELRSRGHIVETGDTITSEQIDNLASTTKVISGYKLLFREENSCTETATAYVSISSEGDLVLARSRVIVYDADNDGALTINDALTIAHEKNYSSGKHGYVAENTQWGLSIAKLWGIDNGGSYGYYVNDASAWSLTDSIADNDYLYAFSYEDAAYYSDTFSYFTANHAEVSNGESVTLTLMSAGYDAEWNPINAPLANAKIMIDGVYSGYNTDSNGSVTIPVNEAGRFVITAETDDIAHLVPPVCVISVAD